jgi:hypothetical protein
LLELILDQKWHPSVPIFSQQWDLGTGQKLPKGIVEGHGCKRMVWDHISARLAKSTRMSWENMDVIISWNNDPASP